ncbi:hypothetical protein K466DRAFT_266053 [Polyporus arcularius HHB13444]|uniref:Uncharacterized protein n=1 Tax=Polyporus arcularius HHB13444 TaxID=1314778 RepID=A0A5C3PQF2_9APHY|nr:hypothetical protein K466DRAFT_266053 [Polyporus arcularius HHB13444]
MTRIIHRVIPHLKDLVPRPPLARSQVPRRAPVFSLSPENLRKDAQLRRYYWWGGLGVTCALFLATEHFFPSPPSNDELYLAVATNVVAQALKGKISQAARNMKGAKAGAVQTPQTKSAKAGTAQTTQKHSVKAADILSKRSRKKRRRLRLRK